MRDDYSAGISLIFFAKGCYTCDKVASNLICINYYFKSKELLYRKILEVIFAEYDNRDTQDWERKTPQAQLKAMITNFSRMLYKEDALTSDMTSIFISEMTRPSPFIEELVDKYNRPRIKRHLKMFRDLLGKDAPDDVVRDCLVSVAGQLFYHSFAWPVFSRLFPDYSTDDSYEKWADHVYQFSMGGIEAIKTQWESTKGGYHGD